MAHGTVWSFDIGQDIAGSSCIWPCSRDKFVLGAVVK